MSIVSLELFISSNQFGASQFVFRDFRFQFGFACSGFQVKSRIKRVKFEKISVRSGRRARADVGVFFNAVCTLNSRGAILFYYLRFRVYIPNKRMRESAHWRVRVVHNQRQIFSVFRNAAYFQFWIDAIPLARKFGRNRFVIFKFNA